MAEILEQDDIWFSLDSIDGEADSKPQPGSINVSPRSTLDHCYCCGRHLHQLDPFGKAGDPLVGDFDGELLVTIYRPFLPRNEEAQRIHDKYFNKDQNKGQSARAQYLMALHYGTEEAQRIIYTVQAATTVGKSYECRDCVILSNEEYFEEDYEKMISRMKPKCD